VEIVDPVLARSGPRGNDEGLRNVFIPPVFTVGGSSEFPGVNIAQGAQDQDGRSLKVLDWYVDLAPKAAARARIGQFKVPSAVRSWFGQPAPDDRSRIASDFFARDATEA
jgi:hypothetical protein